MANMRQGNMQYSLAQPGRAAASESGTYNGWNALADLIGAYGASKGWFGDSGGYGASGNGGTGGGTASPVGRDVGDTAGLSTGLPQFQMTDWQHGHGNNPVIGNGFQPQGFFGREGQTQEEQAPQEEKSGPTPMEMYEKVSPFYRLNPYVWQQLGL